MGFLKKVEREFKQNGPVATLWKIRQRAIRFLFYSSCSMWYELTLDKPLPDLTPGIDLETVFLVEDKSELISWLQAYKPTYTWIYDQKEIDSAVANKHIFYVLKHRNRIIGYVKIGMNQIYIRDFDVDVTFEPETTFIYDTFILPEHRGKNLSGFALNQLAQHLKQQGFRKILCHIEKWNVPSVKSYRKAGFQEIGSIRFVRVVNFSLYIYKGYKPYLKLEKILHLG